MHMFNMYTTGPWQPHDLLKLIRPSREGRAASHRLRPGTFDEGMQQDESGNPSETLLPTKSIAGVPGRT